jgi:hypothetical protein
MKKRKYLLPRPGIKPRSFSLVTIPNLKDNRVQTGINSLEKVSRRWKEEDGTKLRKKRSFGKTRIDGDA